MQADRLLQDTVLLGRERAESAGGVEPADEGRIECRDLEHAALPDGDAAQIPDLAVRERVGRPVLVQPEDLAAEAVPDVVDHVHGPALRLGETHGQRQSFEDRLEHAAVGDRHDPTVAAVGNQQRAVGSKRMTRFAVASAT